MLEEVVSVNIVRNIIANRRVTSLEVETIHGVPVHLSVDLDQVVHDGWSIKLGPLTPSTELKLKAGIYTDVGNQGILKKLLRGDQKLLRGDLMNYRDFRSLVWLGTGRLSNDSFSDIVPEYGEEILKWAKDAFVRGRCALDETRLSARPAEKGLSLSGGVFTCREVARKLGVSPEKRMWGMFYPPDFDPDNSVMSSQVLPWIFDLNLDLEDVTSALYGLKPEQYNQEDVDYFRECLNR